MQPGLCRLSLQQWATEPGIWCAATRALSVLGLLQPTMDWDVTRGTSVDTLSERWRSTERDWKKGIGPPLEKATEHLGVLWFP
jgi:hypothetical protein